MPGACPVRSRSFSCVRRWPPAEHAYQILVDNHASKENTARYAEHQGYHVQVEEQDGEYTLTFIK